MNRAGSTIIDALETAWEAIREQHPEVPAVVMITGTGSEGRGLKWGHHWRDRWSLRWNPEERVTELFISGERLACGARLTMQTLLHEAAHAIANTRGVQDCSRQGRYHNKRFVAIAEELGLAYNAERPDPVIGFSAVELTEAAERDYAGVIGLLDEELVAHLGVPSIYNGGTITTIGTPGTVTPLPAPPKKVDRNRATCGCGRIIRVAPATLAGAAITCGACGEDFTHANADLALAA